MPNSPAKLIISVKSAWPSAPTYRGRFPFGPTQVGGAAVSVSTVTGTFVSSGGIATLVQSAVKDPNPNYNDSYDNGAADGTHCVAQSAEFTGNTTAGNLLLAYAMVAWDGQYLITNVSDPVNGSWDLEEVLLNTTNCNSHSAIYCKRNAQPLLHTSWSGVGAVSAGGILTLGAGSGPFRLGQRVLSAGIPVPGNTQNVSSRASFDNIVTAVSLLSGVLGAAGSTYQLNPNIGSVTFGSQAMTTRDFVSATRLTPDQHVGSPQVVGDYPGIYLAEFSGTDNTNVYFNAHNDAPSGAGTDTVTSGALGAVAASGLVIGFGLNGGINGVDPHNLPSPAPVYAPAAGTGFGTSSQLFSFNLGNPAMTVEMQHFANISGKAATFSPPAASNYASMVVAFLDAPPTAQLGESFSWEPPTQNLDNSALTGGEVTGYEVGVRTGGSAGTYSIIMAVDGPFTSADLIANIQPPLSSGTYFAAVRAVGPTDSAWSPESTFTV